MKIAIIDDENFECALIYALKLKGNNTITLFNIGLSNIDSNIRKGLALGANDAIRFNVESHDSYFISETYSKYLHGYDLILTGKDTIIGGTIAGILDYPFIITNDTNIQFEFPMIISVSKSLEVKIPNMKDIMSARNKPIQIIEVNDQSLTKEISRIPNPGRSECKYVSINELAKIINEI